MVVHGVASSTRREVAALLPEASIHDLSGVSGSGVSGSGPPGPSPPGPGAVRADLAVMEVGSHVGQARIAAEFFELAGHMREGAVLLVVTARRRGSARQLKTLDRMFGAAEVAHRSGSAVVLRAVRGPVVRATADATAAAPTVEVALLGRDLRFETGVGLFSKSRIDNGTRLLLKALPREHGWRDVLDLGCGYGPIGIAVASRWPQVRVVMADIDPLAVTAARTNAQTNGGRRSMRGLRQRRDGGSDRPVLRRGAEPSPHPCPEIDATPPNRRVTKRAPARRRADRGDRLGRGPSRPPRFGLRHCPGHGREPRRDLTPVPSRPSG